MKAATGIRVGRRQGREGKVWQQKGGGGAPTKLAVAHGGAMEVATSEFIGRNGCNREVVENGDEDRWMMTEEGGDGGLCEGERWIDEIVMEATSYPLLLLVPE
ncbi:putative transmembrane protein [Sesbania bispinosa]|nr:putative transmembrane protein [Sesbania bispinosa]